MKQHLISSGLAAADFIHRYPRRITATLAALMLSGASGAFAVATLAPAGPLEPIRLVSDSIQLAPLDAQLDLLQTHSFTLYRSGRTQKADSAELLLERLGFADPLAAAFLRRDKATWQALFSRNAAGRTVVAEADEQLGLRQLKAYWIDAKDETQVNRLLVEKTDDGFSAVVEAQPLVVSQRLASGTVGAGALTITGEAELPSEVSEQLATMFNDGGAKSKTALRRGERFAAVYEVLEAEDGTPLRIGRVLGAEIDDSKRTRRALWFDGPQEGAGEYFSFDGERVRKPEPQPAPRPELIAPLTGRLKITSGFGLRLHPVLHQRLGHAGIDISAPTGTAVHAVASGKVHFAGTQRGYGKVVYVEHAGVYGTTIYGHLSEINVKVGQRIAQGDKLGEVGSTGIATGPHLHFEVRVNGVARDPEPVLAAAAIKKKPEPVVQPREQSPAFVALASAMQRELAAADQLQPSGFE